MKVLIISRGVPTPQSPLNGIFEWDQAVALSRQGIKVAVMALDFRNVFAVRPWGYRRYFKKGIPVFEWSLPTGVYRRALPLLQHWCYALYQKVEKKWGKPDILHAHFYFMGAIASQLPVLTGVPLIHTEHSSKLNKPLDAISSLDRKLAQKAYQHAAQVLAVSSSQAAVLTQNFGITPRVVPNVSKCPGVNLFQAKEKVFTWLTVGRLIASKGMMSLLHAFKEALAQNPRQRLWIIGDGPEQENIYRAILAMDLAKQVTMLGALPRFQVLSYMAKAHAFVLLSESETFGLVYVEALAHGLPVVATDCGGPSDFVQPDNGLLVPVNQVQAAAQAMLHIQGNYDAYNPVQIAADTKKRFSFMTIGATLKEIYSNTLLYASC